MKMNLFPAVSAFLLAVSPSWGGMPDEDPLVRDLHSRFRSARPPTAEEMTAGQWECVSHATMRGQFERKQLRIRFTREGSALRLGGDAELYFANEREWVQTSYTRYSGGHSITQFVSFRMDERDRLVGEGAGQLSEQLGTRLELRASTSATTSPRAYAVVFLDCAPL